MRPRSIWPSSSACAAGRSPTRSRMAGSTLVAIAGTCRTTKTLAGRSAGSLAMILRSASTPPADAPTTTMSCPVVWSSGDTPLRFNALRSMIAPLSRPSIVVAALGDSITEGSPGLRGWDVWAARADPRLDIRNCGVYGQRTDEIAARLDECARGADVLIVQRGINDIAQGRDAAAAAENLREMIRRGKELGLRVVLADVLPWNNGWPDAEPEIRWLNELVAAIAEDEAVRLLAFHDALQDPDRPGRMREEWTHEGDHPNDEGYRRLADVVLRALEAEGVAV